MDYDNHRDYINQDIPSGQFPTSQSGPITQFLNGMPDWMNMTPEEINLAVERLPNPSEGHNLLVPGISLQEGWGSHRGK
jgi:hypothetical protein